MVQSFKSRTRRKTKSKHYIRERNRKQLMHHRHGLQYFWDRNMHRKKCKRKASVMAELIHRKQSLGRVMFPQGEECFALPKIDPCWVSSSTGNLHQSLFSVEYCNVPFPLVLQKFGCCFSLMTSDVRVTRLHRINVVVGFSFFIFLGRTNIFNGLVSS